MTYNVLMGTPSLTHSLTHARLPPCSLFTCRDSIRAPSPLVCVLLVEEATSNLQLVCSTDVQQSLTIVRQESRAFRTHHLFSHIFHASDLCFEISTSLCLRFNGHFSRWTWVSRYRNVSILDFIGAKDEGGGGDSQSYKTC